MAANGNTNGNGGRFWHYLIQPDKSATSQLQDLCLGLAKVVRDLEPGPDYELTPQRLAAFYRQTGGNYDSVFLSTDNHGISFMYRTLGCRHSLQPTSNDFETPSVPCLTSLGFAKWQTLQLLLCPEDSVRSLQKAVEIYNIPRQDGGYFPRSIPADCFPARPDEAMERWYKDVTGRLNQDHYVRRIKNSPYQSPLPEDTRDGYFAYDGRPPKPSRVDSHDDQARLAEYRRRSSVPDIVSPLAEGAVKGSHWDPATRQERKTRSHSAQRPAHTRQRSNTNPISPTHTSKQHQSSHAASRKFGSNPEQLQPHLRPLPSNPQSYQQRPSSGQHRNPSTVEEDSGSEASSETSRNGHRSHHRKSDEERPSRRSSLWPPAFFKSKSHKRRHSSDASPRKIEAKPQLPSRADFQPPKHGKYPPPQPVLQPQYRSSPGVRFRDDIFKGDGANSVPETPVQRPNAPPPTIRYPDPPPYPTQQMQGMMVGQPLNRENSSSSGTDRRYNSDFDRYAPRKAGTPVRVSTVTGVSGRKYPNNELSPSERERQHMRVIRGSLPTVA